MFLQPATFKALGVRNAVASSRLERLRAGRQPITLSNVATRLTVYMDPYGRFFLSDRRAAYPVNVELPDGYQVVEDDDGGKVLIGPRGNHTEVAEALRMGLARML